jgi:hypothetical protein
MLPAFLVAALTLPLLGKSLRSTQSAPERILFAVWSAQATKDPAAPIVDPIGVLAGSHIHSLGDYNKLPDAFFDRFEKTYYAPGRMFPFLMGGSSKGRLTIRNATGIYCVSLVATVKLPIPLAYPQMALAATSTEGLGLHEDWRRPPTSDQRTAFLQLSVAYLKNKPLQPFKPSEIKIDGLYLTKMGLNQPDSLIGSVTLT